MKIQTGIEAEKKMTRREKDACKCLLKDPNAEDDDEGSGANMSFAQTFHYERKRKAVEIEAESRYIDTRFITGAAAIVESLWSEQDALQSGKRRSGMTPLTIECILFLKKNHDLWSIKDVNQANEDRKMHKRDERHEKKQKEDNDMAAAIAALDLVE